jgi:hypothetical protein
MIRPVNAVWELEHLARHCPLDAMDARNAVAEGDHASHFSHVDLHRVTADLVANDLGDFFRSDVHINPDCGGDLAPSAVSRPTAFGEPLSHSGKLRGNTPVVDGAADPGDDSADDRLVNLRGHVDGTSCDPRETLL